MQLCLDLLTASPRYPSGYVSWEQIYFLKNRMWVRNDKTRDIRRLRWYQNIVDHMCTITPAVRVMPPLLAIQKMKTGALLWQLYLHPLLGGSLWRCLPAVVACWNKSPPPTPDWICGIRTSSLGEVHTRWTDAPGIRIPKQEEKVISAVPVLVVLGLRGEDVRCEVGSLSFKDMLLGPRSRVLECKVESRVSGSWFEV